MILLKLTGHKYLNEISDIIKLFYGKETIMKFDDPDAEAAKDQAVFIASNIIRAEDLTSFTSTYSFSGNNQSYTLSKAGHMTDPKDIKKALKISMYKLLSDVTGKELPWGILTGIRPVKIVHKLMESGKNIDEIIAHLKDEYYVSEERALLAVRVAKAEEKYLRQRDNKKISVYVGIPFCPTRCNYCSFTSNSIDKNKDLIKPYMDAMLKEIRVVSGYLSDKGIKAQSVYIGGGTPTSLNENQLDELMRCINEFWYDTEEFTCEAGRPDTITADKLRVMKENGVTRLSINPQTMDDETLARIGRKHTHAQIVESFELSRSFGFDNINMDMILGLPGEGLEQVNNTLKWICKLNPENVTVHTMAIKRASIYNTELSLPKAPAFRDGGCQREVKSSMDSTNIQRGMNPTLNEVSFNKTNPELGIHCDDLAFEMMELARSSLERNGYHPYYLYRQKYMAQSLENIGFCKKDRECIYNIQIMEEKQSIAAFGADAVTKVYYEKEDRLERQHNIKDLKLYIEKIEEQIDRKIALLDSLNL